MYDVSIIIVNYNTTHLVCNCISSILEKTKGVSYEVIVVDNHSDETLPQEMQRRFSDKVRVVMLDENVGFGRANNEGFAIAQGRHFFCLNPDTLLVDDSVSTLCQYLDSHADVGACGGNLYDEQMHPTLSFRRLFPSLRWELHELTLHKLEPLVYGSSWRFNHGDTPMEVAYVTGADLMLRADVARRLGGFCPDFFMYYEETDLCLHIHRLGLKVVAVPQARIQHLEGKSFRREGEKTFSENGLKFSEMGRNTYYRRNLRPLHRKLCNVVYRLSLHALAIFFSLLHNPVCQAYRYRIEVQRTLKS